MKKIYLSALSLAIATGLNAQQLQNRQPAPKHSTFGNTGIVHNGTLQKLDLYSNDCSDISEWTITDLLPGGAIWYHETDPAAVPNNGPAAMTTVANGYLHINSDAEGDGANQNTSIELNTAIDLSGQPNVTLEFEQNYRTYLDQRYVEVSGDGGTTWTQFTVTDGTETGGTNVANTFSVDISAVAGGQSDVRIKFLYIGSWGWHWAVDDILIKTTEPFDLRADGYVWGVTGSWGPRLPYYNTPTAQIQPIEFCGIASNIGLNDVTDATYAIDINGGTFVDASAPSALVAGTFDTICSANTFTPAGVATFVMNHGIDTPGNTDTDLTNNAHDALTFDVVDYIYARDYVAAGDQGGTYNQGDGFESGNIYDIFADADLQGIQVVIDANAVAGALIYGKLYEIDAAGDFIQVTQSAYYTLTAADLGNPIDLTFVTGAYPLTAGQSYLVTVGSDGDGGLTNDLVISASGSSEPQTTFYWDATQSTWFYSTTTSAVRMNFDPILSVDNVENVSGLNVYPNPAIDETTVSFALNNASDVNVTVTNLAGQEVYTNALGNVAAGTSEVSINTAELSNGVYLVNVVVDGAASTQKLIIKK
ncbi:MAG: T9SS type A sorting domain-containing protein [Crocinitomicaceae bacterium]|nr:T9SS type A sorting domain-containing protein [Crocinitomicaceae bacterium]